MSPTTRGPLLLLVASAVFWLLVGTMLAFVASIQLHTPTFLGDTPWLTFGRVRAAHLAATIYGWASLGGVALILWLHARLCDRALPWPNLLGAGCILWNLALAAGILAILAGGSTGIEWLELPSASLLIISGVLTLVATMATVMLLARRDRTIHVSLAYAYSAALWFPFLCVLVTLLMHGRAGRGVGQAIVNWWFVHNLLCLWLTPIGLAVACDLIPQRSGRPLHSQQLARFAFWSLLIAYHGAALHHLIGGPLPTWLITIGVVCSVLLLISVLAVTTNLYQTVRGQIRSAWADPVLRFVMVGIACYLLVSVQGAAQSLRTVNTLTHFTQYTIGHAHLGVYGFYSLILFGAVYHILPRLTAYQPSRLLMDVHFWLAFAGVGVYWVSMTVGGIVQGLLQANPDVPFINTVQPLVPFLAARSLAAYLMTMGHALFAWVVVHSLLPIAQPTPVPAGAAS